MDLVYGVPTLVALLVALTYVRRIARRHSELRKKARRPSKKYLRSLSQRSEMRAAENTISVMDEIQRTHSTPAKRAPDTDTSARRKKTQR